MVETDAEHDTIEENYFCEVVDPLVESLHMVNGLDFSEAFAIERQTVHHYFPSVELVSHGYEESVAVGPFGRILTLGA